MIVNVAPLACTARQEEDDEAWEAIDCTKSTARIILQSIPRLKQTWKHEQKFTQQEQVYCFEEKSVVVVKQGELVWFDRTNNNQIGQVQFDCLLRPTIGAFNATGELFAVVGHTTQVFVVDCACTVTSTSPLLEQQEIAGVGFTVEKSDLLVCTRMGEVFCALKIEGTFKQLVQLQPIVAANSPAPPRMETDFALVASEKLYLINACAVSVLILHETNQQLPRLIPFQQVRFSTTNVPSSLFSPLVVAVDNLVRNALGIPTWRDLERVNSGAVNKENKLCITTRMRQVCIVDMERNGKQVAKRDGVLHAVWFSTNELALLEYPHSTLAICTVDLQANLLDQAVDIPAGLKSLATSRSGVTALNHSNVLLDISPCTTTQVLEQKLAGNDFAGAFEFCQRKQLSNDPVHKRIFETNPVTQHTMEEHLAKISNNEWVLQTCAERIPADYDNALALLQFGLDLAVKVNQQHAVLAFHNHIERLLAYHCTFASAGFDSKQYKKFRDAEDATEIAKQLATQGLVKELCVFLGTDWGHKHHGSATTVVLDCISEVVPPSEYKSLLTSPHDAQWFVDRAIDIDNKSGLLTNALELMEIGLELHGEELKQAVESTRQLVRLVFHLQVDFSLALHTWLDEMTCVEKLELCQHVDVHVFAERVFPLYSQLSPMQQKPWLAALQDFLPRLTSVDQILDILFKQDTDLVFRNRVDGRLVVLQVAMQVLRTRADLTPTQVDYIFNCLDSELDASVELVMWPKRFASLRAELDETRSEYNMLSMLLVTCGLSGVTLPMLQRARREKDGALLARLLSQIKTWKQGSNELLEFVHIQAVQLGAYLSVPKQQVFAMALKQVLLNGKLFHMAANDFNALLANDADSLIEVYTTVLRDLFLQDDSYDDLLPKAINCLNAAPKSVAPQLDKFHRLITVAEHLRHQHTLPAAALLIQFEKNPTELLRNIMEEQQDLQTALTVAPLLGASVETLVSFLLHQSELQQAQNLVNALLESPNAGEEDKFMACQALSKTTGLDFYRMQALLLAPSGKDLISVLDLFANDESREHPYVKWIEDETAWKRCCAASALAQEEEALPSSSITLQSELGCLTLLNSVEIANQRFDQLDNTIGGIKQRFSTIFPNIKVDFKQEDPIKRFQMISSQLRIPTNGGGGSCFDLGVELDDRFVLHFFRALKHKHIAQEELEEHRNAHNFAYAQEKLGDELCVDAEFKLSLLEAISPHPDMLAKKRSALHDLLLLAPHIHLKHIGFGKGCSQREEVLKNVVEQMTYCSDARSFAKLVAEVSDCALRPSEILMQFMEHLLLFGGEEDDEQRFAWAHNAYSKQCRALLHELEEQDALEFARKVAFSTHKLALRTRLAILNDLLSANKEEEEITLLAELIAVPIPSMLQDEFCAVAATASRENVRNAFALPHVFDLDLQVSEQLARVCGYSWEDVLFEAICGMMVSNPPVLLFPLPRAVATRLEEVHNPQVIKYMVSLGIASPVRLRDAQILQVASTHALPPLEEKGEDWLEHLRAHVQSDEQARGGLEIVRLLGKHEICDEEEELLIVNMILKLDSATVQEEWVEKFPRYLKHCAQLVRGLFATGNEELAFKVALRDDVHVKQCLEEINHQVSPNSKLDFVVLFQRLGVASEVVWGTIDQVEQSVCAGNSFEYAASCCRLASELVVKRDQVMRACKLVYLHRKTVVSHGTNALPVVGVLELYFHQVLEGIQSGASRLQFTCETERLAAMAALQEALRKCAMFVVATKQPTKTTGSAVRVKKKKQPPPPPVEVQNWEADLFGVIATTTTTSKTEGAWDDDLGFETTVAKAATTAVKPKKKKPEEEDWFNAEPQARVAAATPTTWEVDELDFGAAKPKTDALDLLLSSTPVKKKIRPKPVATAEVDSTLALLMTPSSAATVAAPKPKTSKKVSS